MTAVSLFNYTVLFKCGSEPRGRKTTLTSFEITLCNISITNIREDDHVFTDSCSYRAFFKISDTSHRNLFLEHKLLRAWPGPQSFSWSQPSVAVKNMIRTVSFCKQKARQINTFVMLRSLESAHISHYHVRLWYRHVCSSGSLAAAAASSEYFTLTPGTSCTALGLCTSLRRPKEPSVLNLDLPQSSSGWQAAVDIYNRFHNTCSTVLDVFQRLSTFFTFYHNDRKTEWQKEVGISSGKCVEIKEGRFEWKQFQVNLCAFFINTIFMNFLITSFYIFTNFLHNSVYNYIP